MSNTQAILEMKYRIVARNAEGKREVIHGWIILKLNLNRIKCTGSILLA